MNVLEKILEEKEIVAIKELIEENEKCFNQCEGACFDVEDGICNCDDGVIVQAIRKMKKYLELAKDTNVPSKNGWIPVSEKLPEESSIYIVSAKEGDREIVTFVKWQNRFKKWDLSGTRAYWRVTAWKPLPKPYKEG